MDVAHHCIIIGLCTGHPPLGDLGDWYGAAMVKPLPAGDKPSGTYFSAHFRWQAHTEGKAEKDLQSKILQGGSTKRGEDDIGQFLRIVVG